MATEAEEEVEVAVPGSRSQMVIHEAQVAWLEEVYEIDLSKYTPAEMIAIAYATRVAWRQTDEYHTAKGSIGEAREAEKAEKAAAREAAKEAKAAEKAAKDAAKAEKAQGSEKAPAAKKAAAPAKKAAKKSGAKKDPFAK